MRLLQTHGIDSTEGVSLPTDTAPLSIFGQEFNPSTFAIARMNALIHDMDAEIALGDTMEGSRWPGASSPARIVLRSAR